MNVAVDKAFFSFLGIMLSLLLAFRTNTAYDRFYEGRRLTLTQIANRIRANAHEILGVELHEDIRNLADVPYSVVF